MIDRYCKRLKKMVRLAASKPGHGKHRLYAEIWRDEHRVSFGWNNPKSDELSARYKRSELAEGTCAEAEAVIQALSKHKPVRGATLLVARAKKPYRGADWEPGVSKPCAGCRRLLVDFGISEVGYISEDGDYVFESVLFDDSGDRSELARGFHAVLPRV